MQSARSGRVPVEAANVTRMSRLSRVERECVVERYEAGESQVALAKAFRVHRDTINRCLEAVEVDRRRPGLNEDQLARAAELYDKGLSLADVGVRIGKASSSVRSALLRAGVPLRGRYERRKDGHAT